MSPLNAKLRFRLRTLTNIGITLVIFVPLVFVLTQFLDWWLADALAIGVAFCLFFLVLGNRAIKIRCPHCTQLITSNTPWVCGFCQATNKKIEEFPFVHKCEHCSAEPKAYKCHHCGKLVFLTEDQLKANYASCVNTAIKEEPPPDEAALRDKEQKGMEHKLVMEKMTAELEEMKRKAELAKPKSPQEKVEESFSRHHVSYMAAHDIARREKAANAEKYKDDPYLLERANESVDDWLQKHL